MDAGIFAIILLYLVPILVLWLIVKTAVEKGVLDALRRHDYEVLKRKADLMKERGEL